MQKTLLFAIKSRKYDQYCNVLSMLEDLATVSYKSLSCTIIFMKYFLLLPDIEEIARPSLHYAGSMMQLVKLPKELKIPFEDLEFEAKMIGEGKV